MTDVHADAPTLVPTWYWMHACQWRSVSMQRVSSTNLAVARASPSAGNARLTRSVADLSTRGIQMRRH
eukprot:3737757-Prymnesium_polylepis.1